MDNIALYPGSFDPMTLGHMDILRQALQIAGRVVVAIGVHPEKKALFSFDERRDMIHTAVAGSEFAGLSSKLSVVAFDDLTVEAARRHNASFMVRGLRDGTDLNYEMQLAGMNGALAPEIGTVFLPAHPFVRPISATLVRQIASQGGDVSAFVPPNIAKMLGEHFKNR